VVMASGVFTLLRSIAGTLGSAVSVALYEQRYFALVQRYAESNDLNALGLQEALVAVRSFLTAAGEATAGLATQTSVVIQQRLLAEATTMAYQDYFLLAALTGLLAIVPALPFQECWQALRRRAPLPSEGAVTEPEHGGRAVLVSQDTRSRVDLTPAARSARLWKPGKR